MTASLEIDFRNLGPSPALDALIRHRLAGLESQCAVVTSCHVAVEAPHQHQRQGRHFSVHLRLRLPGTELVVSRDRDSARHEHADAAVRDAFDVMERRLHSYLRRLHGDVKQHSLPSQPPQA